MIDDFKLIVVNTPPKLTDQEKRSIETPFGYSSKYQSIDNNAKIITTNILKSWNGNKSSTYPSAHAIIPEKL